MADDVKQCLFCMVDGLESLLPISNNHAWITANQVPAMSIWSNIFRISLRCTDTSHRISAKVYPGYWSKLFVWEWIGTLPLRFCATQIFRQLRIVACTNLAPNILPSKPDLTLTDPSVELSKYYERSLKSFSVFEINKNAMVDFEIVQKRYILLIEWLGNLVSIETLQWYHS